MKGGEASWEVNVVAPWACEPRQRHPDRMKYMRESLRRQSAEDVVADWVRAWRCVRNSFDCR